MIVAPCRILVIDHEPDFLDFMATLLREEGHRVMTAASIEAARGQLEVDRPDLIISDLSIWNRSPEQILAALDQQPVSRDIPVLFCTALKLEVEPATTLFDRPNVDVVLKPFDIEDLLSRVARLCGNSDDQEARLGD